MIIRMLALAAFGTLMLAAACGGDDNATTTPKTATQTTAALTTATQTTTARATATPGATQTAAPSTQTATPVVINPPVTMNLTITAADFSLSPANFIAAPGEAINVTFNNTGAATHSFTVGGTDVTQAAGGSSTSGSFTTSATTVEFHCKFHPTQMKGTITITG